MVNERRDDKEQEIDPSAGVEERNDANADPADPVDRGKVEDDELINDRFQATDN